MVFCCTRKSKLRGKAIIQWFPTYRRGRPVAKIRVLIILNVAVHAFPQLQVGPKAE